MVDDKTGYIALTKFNSKASFETAGALKELKAAGAEKLILDLRGNPGGLLHEAVNIVKLFVPKGQLVVTTKSKIKSVISKAKTQADIYSWIAGYEEVRIIIKNLANPKLDREISYQMTRSKVEENLIEYIIQNKDLIKKY